VPETVERVRLQVAFEGGQSVGAFVRSEAADALQKALADGQATFELETDDGTYLLALGKVVYVKRAARETQIGFGAA
jgi:hypothetical protein